MIAEVLLMRLLCDDRTSDMASRCRLSILGSRQLSRQGKQGGTFDKWPDFQQWFEIEAEPLLLSLRRIVSPRLIVHHSCWNAHAEHVPFASNATFFVIADAIRLGFFIRPKPNRASAGELVDSEREHEA